MKKHTSQEAFYERMRNLSDIKSTSVNESKNRTLGTLIDYERAANGVAYGIIKEQHKYYIKKGGLNENQTVADFAYIGGVQNITDYQYDKLSEAEKIRNMLLKTINEGIETKVNPNGSKKKILTEDKASQEIDMAASKVDDLDAATDAAATAEDPLNTDGEAEMAAGVEDMPVDDVAPDADVDVNVDEPIPDGEEGGEPAPDVDVNIDEPAPDADVDVNIDEPAPDGEEGGENGEPNGEEEGGDEATREIEKSLGKLTNTLRKTELTDSQIISYVKTFLSAFKEKFPDIDIEDRKEMAEKITKVVPPEDIEDLGQNVEDTDGEPELEEAGCSECGTFAQYAESRGYDANTIKECGEEEMSNLVSGYANAYGDGENNGDHKSVALFIKLMPEVLEILKNEYGHDEYAGELEPEVNSMDESTDEDIDAQINELFGGLGNLAKKGAQGIKKGVQAVGQGIADKTQQVGQAVGQAATGVKQAYYAGEKNATLGKLEKVAADLGKQIAQVNAQAQKAGQEPINVNSILTTIKNQVAGSGSANLSKYRTNEEGIPVDHTEVQPMMEDENEDDENVLDLTKREEPEMPIVSGVDTMGGGVVKPDSAETTTVEVTKDSVNVTMNEAIQKLRENLNEISNDLTKKIQESKTVKEGNKYTKKLAKTPKGGAFKIDGETEIDTSNYDDKSVKENKQMTESEIKLRKYIRNRLQEHAGLRKPNLNEGKKSETLLKLDKLIDKQFNLYETVVKNKIKK